MFHFLREAPNDKSSKNRLKTSVIKTDHLVAVTGQRGQIAAVNTAPTALHLQHVPGHLVHQTMTICKPRRRIHIQVRVDVTVSDCNTL